MMNFVHNVNFILFYKVDKKKCILLSFKKLYHNEMKTIKMFLNLFKLYKRKSNSFQDNDC